MRTYIARRLFQLIPILLGITLLSFLLINTGTADVIDVLESNTGGVMTEEEKESFRVELGLDKPLVQQYVLWLFRTLQGDMGESFVSGQPVFDTFLYGL